MPSSTYTSLRRLVDSLPVASSHEHLLPDDRQQELTLDSLLANSYVKMLDIRPGETADERAYFLEACRTNGLFGWLERAILEIYQLDTLLTPANWEEVSRHIATRHAEKDAHLAILRHPARYRRAIQDAYWEYGSDNGHPELLSATMRTDMFLSVFHPDLVDHDGNSPFRHFPHAPQSNFADYLGFLEELFSGWRNRGAVAMKSAIAYERSLDFGAAEQQDAARLFLRDPRQVDPAERKRYGDFMFHWFCALAERLGVPFQVHAGLGRLGGSAPMLLEPALARHPGTTFVLFHVGYPWYDAVAGLAHSYANVIVDLVWIPLLTVSGAAGALHELLDVARSNERICWGGDARTAEEAFGALSAWRHVVASVLAEKVGAGCLASSQAERLADPGAIQLAPYLRQVWPRRPVSQHACPDAPGSDRSASPPRLPSSAHGAPVRCARDARPRFGYGRQHRFAAVGITRSTTSPAGTVVILPRARASKGPRPFPWPSRTVSRQRLRRPRPHRRRPPGAGCG